MPIVRLVAQYDKNHHERLVLIGLQDERGYYSRRSEAFGYVVDLCDETKSLMKYPFFIQPGSEILDWGGFDDDRSEIDIFDRRIVKGEKITRTQTNQRFEYTVTGVANLCT